MQEKIDLAENFESPEESASRSIREKFLLMMQGGNTKIFLSLLSNRIVIDPSMKNVKVKILEVEELASYSNYKIEISYRKKDKLYKKSTDFIFYKNQKIISLIKSGPEKEIRRRLSPFWINLRN